ncbi:tRNA modification GTPase MnmE [Candidatus Providencia siddallii]|uniref:tRNA modification GTPase MnmE n=1 Tax=Candidatus Providencia siddallii TaxID=1715285 RepID=A0A0M6W9C6_9GAMM|nr:tRNA modification GTPase MnmE [Candidatus Providencia siddallii]
MIKKIESDLNHQNSYLATNSYDTIVAQITPVSRSAVGILRISGSKVVLVAKEILKKIPKPRYATYLPFYDLKGFVLDNGIAIFFPGPNSFTGEDVLELQGHGGIIILDLLLKRILDINGVRIASPGEFCKRAFLNNKFNLTQAEAISDLIEANSEQAAHFAIKSLQGAFSSNIYQLIEKLKNLRVNLEFIIDFSDEEDDFVLDKIKHKFNELILNLKNTISQTKCGISLREGIKIVIAGPPNVGKSSLLNILAGCDVAIVTSISGTTRDVIRKHIHIDGIPMYIIDTAGLCESNNEVECIGIERAWKEIEQADRILYVVDSSMISSTEQQICSDFMNRIPNTIPITIIRNKIDITKEEVKFIKNKNYSIIFMSIRERVGIDLLYNHLREIIGLNTNTEGLFLARRRHLEALNSAANYLSRCYEQLNINSSFELLAEELRLAQNELNKITGEFTSDDLLNTIFSSFCVGK